MDESSGERDRLLLQVLGPLRAQRHGTDLTLGGTKQRTILALLLLNAGASVSRDTIIEAVWGADRPAKPENVIQTYLKHLRQVLEPDRPFRAPSQLLPAADLGYLARPRPDQLDLLRFVELRDELETAHRWGHFEDVARLSAAALGLWRGETLADLPGLGDHPRVVALERDRRRVLLRRVDAALALGRAHEVLAVVEEESDRDPLDEALLARLVRSYHACGRRSDALATFDSARRRLAETLGIDPGTELTEAHLSVVRPPAPPRQSPRQHQSQNQNQPRPLPPALTSLVGRDAEVAMVADLVLHGLSRAVTVTGVAGVGKTRLALQVAHRASRALPTAWVPLAGVPSAELVPDAIAEALAEPSAPLTDIVSLVGDRDVLVVLDNLEHLHGLAAVLTDLMAQCPKLRLLGTSRRPVGAPGEREWQLSALAVPTPDAVTDLPRLASVAAVQLFVERVSSIRTGFRPTATNAAAVVELCRRVGGLPLGIELLARQCRGIEPPDLLRHLSEQPHPGAGAETLLAAIDANYQLVEQRSRQAFQALATFRGGWSFDAAVAVIGGHAATLAAINELLAHGLVVPTDGDAGRRFSMLEIIREFAGEHAAKAGREAAAVARHAEFFLERAESAEPVLHSGADPTLMAALDADRDNLRAALNHYLEEDPGRGLRLAIALYRYWIYRGKWREGLSWFGALLGRAADTVDRATLASARLRAASLAADEDLALARDLADAALADFGALGDHAGIAQANSTLGMINRRSGGPRSRTEHLHRSAVAAAERTDDLRTLARCLNNLVTTLLETGDFEEADAFATRAAELAAESGDLFTRTISVHLLGHSSLRRGDLESADTFFQQAIELAEQVNSLALLAAALADRAIANAVLGRVTVAAGLADAATDVADGLGHPDDIGTALHARAEVELAAGRPDATLFAEAIRNIAVGGPMSGVVDALGGIAAASPDLAERASRLAHGLCARHDIRPSYLARQRLRAVAPGEDDIDDLISAVLSARAPTAYT